MIKTQPIKPKQPVFSAEALKNMHDRIDFLAEAALTDASTLSPDAQKALQAEIKGEIAYSDRLVEHAPFGGKLGVQHYREELRRYAECLTKPPHKRLIAAYLSMAGERDDTALRGGETGNIKTFIAAASRITDVEERNRINAVLLFLKQQPQDDASSARSAAIRSAVKQLGLQ